MVRVIESEFSQAFTYPEQFRLAPRRRIAKSYFERGLPLSGARSNRAARAFLKNAVQAVYLTHLNIDAVAENFRAVAVLSLELKAGANLDCDALERLDDLIPYQCIFEVSELVDDTPRLRTVTGLKGLRLDSSDEWKLQSRVQTYYLSQPVEFTAPRLSFSLLSSSADVHEAVLKALMPQELLIQGAPAQDSVEDEASGQATFEAIRSPAEVEALLRERDEMKRKVSTLQKQLRRETRQPQKRALRQQIRALTEQLNTFGL